MLKEHLERELHDSGRIRRRDQPKHGAIEIPLWLTKLRMVEGVQEFCTERQIYSFLDKCILQKCDLSIIQVQRGEEPVAGDS